MAEDKLYEKAMEEIKMLVVDIKEQCEHFAEEYNYEKDWVFSMFKKELNKSIKE